MSDLTVNDSESRVKAFDCPHCGEEIEIEVATEVSADTDIELIK